MASMLSQSIGAVLALVGLGYLTTHVLCAVSMLLKTFVLGGKSLRSYGPKGAWALVTGSSDGIGKEFALQLASKGFNILLVSRTESKLQILGAEIESKYAGQGVKTKYLAMDFARNLDSDYAKLKETVDGLDIAILVNNVGQSYEMPTPFLLTEKKVHDDIITINVTGTLRVTQIVAPGMVSRKRGLILTMGSFGGLLPTPLLSVYSGSKAFLQHWSTALHEELREKGVDVQFILSHMVVSNMSKLRKASLIAPTPKAFVKSALAKIGLGGVGSFAATTTPYWAHALMQWGIERTVGVGSAFALKQNRKMHEDIRVRALRKREREKRAQ
ncbi:estradiol 17-beta-dehydrogenase-like protein 12-b [Tirmania nivea]|nr:estradiol 17-beta-dehydrogenase-like protein 12-b [Tirmania nivea]